MAYKFHVQVEPETLNHAPEFKKVIDDIVKSNKFVVSVGWRPDTGYDLFDHLAISNIFGYIIEIFPQHANAISHSVFRKVKDNVLNYQKHIPASHRGCLLWQDGPENMEMDQAKTLLRTMQKDFNAIIIATPNGHCDHGPYMGNDYEVNLSHWHKEDYEELGFTCVEYLPNNAGLIGYWVNPQPVVHEDVEEFILPGSVALPLRRLPLPSVTLVCADTTYYHTTMNAIFWSACHCIFKEMILFTDDRWDEKGFSLDKVAKMGLRIVKIPTIKGKVGEDSYSHFMIKKIHQHINTRHFLIVQGDGWVCDPTLWTDEFLNYDYIGSKWSFYHDGMEVGNGGFSLRSTRLHAIAAADPQVNGVAHAEDTCLAREYRRYFEAKYDIKYAPVHLANQFAFDHYPAPGPTFGFHSVDVKGYEFAAIDKFGPF